jgi:hypothetical protein
MVFSDGNSHPDFKIRISDHEENDFRAMDYGYATFKRHYKNNDQFKKACQDAREYLTKKAGK